MISEENVLEMKKEMQDMVDELTKQGRDKEASALSIALVLVWKYSKR